MVAGNSEYSIIFEDNDLVVVDKAAGLLSVPILPGSVTNLLDLIREHYSDHEVSIGSVHRIDRYTSGLMAFSKNHDAYAYLLEQFKEHSTGRTYLAVVRGVLEENEGELVHHLKLIKEGFRNIVVPPDEEEATPARLTYRVKRRFRNTTLVEVYLDTGLKNQIRVQFEEIGHQLVGDRHYAPEEEKEPLINRQALHASKLRLKLPSTQEEKLFEAPLPPDMLRLIDYYRWQKKSGRE